MSEFTILKGFRPQVKKAWTVLTTFAASTVVSPSPGLLAPLSAKQSLPFLPISA